MKILLVNQTHSESAKITRVVENLGGSAIPCRLGYEALEKFKSEHPDLVLLDTDMPDISACEIAQKIRATEAANNWTPIIFTGAETSTTDIEKAILAGGDDYLFKPISDAILSAKIRAMYRIVQMRTSLVVLTRKLDTANQDLQRLSSSDGLTGIPNRRFFDETFEREWRRCRRLEKELSIIMCDVDHFKSFNDSYGHQAGDECLRQIAVALAEQADRGGDTPARYGGEEFAVILSDTNLSGAAIVAERIRQSVMSLAVPHDQSLYGVVTVSLGIACMSPNNSNEAQALLLMADQALYRAKHEGRNRIFYPNDTNLL